MCDSHFVTGGPEDQPVKISKPCYAFEEYLRARGYDLAVVKCGFENGEWVNAEDAVDLVDEFLEEHPEFEPHADEIREHASAIGQIGL